MAAMSGGKDLFKQLDFEVVFIGVGVAIYFGLHFR